MNFQNCLYFLEIATKERFITGKDKIEIMDKFQDCLKEKKQFPLITLLLACTSQENIFIVQEKYKNSFRQEKTYTKKKDIFKKNNNQKSKISFFDNTLDKIDNYDVIEMIGSGAMGSVYLVNDRNTNKKYALKTILSSISKNPIAIKRFQKEIQAMYVLRHPNIVKIYNIGQWKGVQYFTMNYIEGKALSHFVLEKTSPKNIAYLIKKIARALHYVHGKNIIHRDIKPANIIVMKNNEPLIMDFGLAKNTRLEKRLTKTGELLGTPSYMAPEQIEVSKGKIDAQTDVYALGVTMYELMTGYLPFAGAEHFQTMRKIVEEKPRNPSDLNSLIPGDLEQICLRAMAKNKSARFLTALEMAEDLERFIDGERLKVPIKIKISKNTKQNLFRFFLSALILLVIVFINYLVVYSHKNTLVPTANFFSQKMPGKIFIKYKVLREKYSIQELLKSATLSIKNNSEQEKNATEILEKSKLIYYFKANWKINQIENILEIISFLSKISYLEKYPHLKLDILMTCYETMMTLLKKENFLSTKRKLEVESMLINMCYNHFLLHYKLKIEPSPIFNSIKKNKLWLKYNSAFFIMKHISNKKEFEMLKKRIEKWKESAIKNYILFEMYEEIFNSKKLHKFRNIKNMDLFYLKRTLFLNNMHPLYIKKMGDFYKNNLDIEKAILCFEKSLELYQLYEKKFGKIFTKKRKRLEVRMDKILKQYSFMYKVKKNPWEE